MKAEAKEVLVGPIEAEVLRVIDGDTLEVQAHIWLGQKLNTKVRIHQIDTPELRGKCAAEKDLAQKAKEKVRLLLENQIIQLKNIQFGKFAGRVLADVQTTNGEDVAAHLIATGLARRYAGRKRASWCG